jgi:hypothetical protein
MSSDRRQLDDHRVQMFVLPRGRDLRTEDQPPRLLVRLWRGLLRFMS